jgi:hypothetical protein
VKATVAVEGSRLTLSVVLVALGIGACLLGGGCAHRKRNNEAVRRPEGRVEHIKLTPETLERLLAYEDAEIRSETLIGAGVTGAFKDVVFFPAHAIEITVKWRPVPDGDADGWNNSPRKELAAYAVQKWFLDPDDYVVPTLAARCVPLDRYRTRHPEAQATIAGTRCVLVVAAVWLDDVEVPETLYDARRFSEDPVYAYHLANFNLLTHLIDHRDGRTGNILVSIDPANRRVFSVDNGVSFGPKVYNIFVQNWDQIRVPALPKGSVDRLRRVTAADLERLGVLLEMRADSGGVLRHVPAGATRDPSKGSRVGDGSIQLGLTQSEIDDVGERLREALEQVDTGKLAMF